MTDFIKEFGEDQKDKKIKVKFEPQHDWDFPHPIKHVDPEDKPDSIKSKPDEDDDDTKSFSAENKISEQQLNEVVTEAVLNFMNGPDSGPTELLKEEQIELENKIKEYCKRPGIMSIYFSEEPQLNEAFVGAIIDPTNRKNWITMKQEVIYKVPYSSRKSLQECASKVWNENKNLLLETGENVSEDYLRQLKQEVDAANREADARYNEVAHQSRHFMSSNPFERFTTQTPNTQEGHRMALSDGQYQMLNKKARDLEHKYRKLASRIKK